MRERGPGIVDAAEKRDRHDNDAEDEAYLLRLDAGADGKAERAGGEAGEDEHEDQEGPAANVRDYRRGRDVIRHGKDDGGGDDALEGGEDDLLDGDGGHGQRTHDAVVDLAGDAELLREWERDSSDAGEHDGDGHETGEEDCGEVDAAAGHGRGGVHGGTPAHVRHDDGEDEEEEQRVHADADDEGQEFAAEHEQVAEEEAEEGARVLDCRRGEGLGSVGRDGGGGHVGLLAEISAGEADEDGFQTGLGDAEIAQAERIGEANDFGEEALGRVRQDPDAFRDDLDGSNAAKGLERLDERFSAGGIAEVELVDLLCADGTFERGGRVLDEDLAVVDDGDAVAEFVGLFHVVRGEDDGDALLPEGADGLPHGDAALRIETGGGLVEEEDLGAVSDGAGDLDALGEASGELGGVGPGALGEVELREELVCSQAGFGAGEAEVEAVKVDVFEDGAGAVEGVVLGYDTDGFARDGGGSDYVDAGDTDAAGGGQGAGGADADGGGLAGAIRAEETEELALTHTEVNTVDGDDSLLAVIHLLQSFNFYDHRWRVSGRGVSGRL